MPGIIKKNGSEIMETPGAGGGCGWCQRWGGDFSKKILLTLFGILLAYLVFYLGVLTRNAIRKYDFIGVADQTERMITITGLGRVTGSNDIAMTTLGFSNTDKDVAKAQADNKKVMEPIMAELKKLGMADKDLQTNYTIYPEYNYTQEKGQEFKGYRVANNVTVKIRDLTKIPAVLSLAGKFGANEVNGLSFTIDDPENLKASARDKALLDAALKAKRLARVLGVQLVEVVSYNEYESGGEPMPIYAYSKADGMGGGGGGPESVATGSRDVVMNVNITYKIASR